jgi:NAD(P)H-flavin reductase
MKPIECRAGVVAVRRLAAEILEADLEMREPSELGFDAGQWVSVPFGPKIVRAYSIASTPRSPRRITLCADVAPGGIGSRWFRELVAGDEVRFKGPLGGFVFSRADGRRPLFVAEEIGIVPVRGLLTELFETGFGRPTALAYWARDPGWLVYDAEFRSLARRYPAFSYHPVLASAAGDWRDAASGLAEVVARIVSDVSNLVAYVAGGEAMIHRVRDVLVSKGMDRKAVKWEKFYTGDR